MSAIAFKATVGELLWAVTCCAWGLSGHAASFTHTHMVLQTSHCLCSHNTTSCSTTAKPLCVSFCLAV